MTTENPACRLLRITGRVQGVGFRWFLGREAGVLGLQGWVRNRRDGSVEALVWGAPGQVARMIHWAAYGPPAACVEHVAVEAASEFPDGFRRLPDA